MERVLCAHGWVRRCAAFVALAAGLGLASCERVEHTDMRPLDQTGMAFRSIETLRELEVTNAEVAELVKVKGVGAPDEVCIELVRIARGRNQAFTSGDAVASLRRAGMAGESILELARLDRLGLEAGEMQAMRLAGIPDYIILAHARRRAQGLPALSGPSLAGMKNAGVGEHALLELVNRGIPDSATEEIIRLRRRGYPDAEILRRFPK